MFCTVEAISVACFCYFGNLCLSVFISGGRCRSSTSRFDVTAIPMKLVISECDASYLKIGPIRFDYCMYVCLYVYLFLCLSVCLSISLSVCLSVCVCVYLSVCVSVYLSACLLFVCSFVPLYVCLSLCTFVRSFVW